MTEAESPAGTFVTIQQEADAITFNAVTDPLGIRADFPIAATRTYLNASYTSAIPKQVVAAGCAFAEGKSTLPSLVLL